MKIPACEFDRLLLHNGFSSSGPSAQDALERMIQQWIATLIANLSQVAPRGTKVTRRHFASLEKTLGAVLGALEKGVQHGGDYWQASEYYGVDSGRYSASPSSHSASATTTLARQGLLQSGGGSSHPVLGVPATKNFLHATGRTFTDGAVQVVRNMLTIMIDDKLHQLRRRFPGQHRLTVLMLSLAV